MFRKVLHRGAVYLGPVLVSSLAVVAPAGSATAGPCDQSKFYTKVSKGPVTLEHRENGNDSYWNPAGGPNKDNVDIRLGIDIRHEEVKRWVVGGEGGIDWKVVEGKISGEYGKSYTTGVSLSKSVTFGFEVPNRHSAWLRVNTYQRVVYWEKFHYVWNGSTCEAVTTDKAFWGDQNRQWVQVYKKGNQVP